MPPPVHSAVGQGVFRFAMPPSLGASAASERGKDLQTFLSSALNRPIEVVVASSYEGLAKDLLSGRVDAAWAPPFVCARIEAMGVRVLVRGVREGASSYRAALVARANEALSLENLQGARAVWTDQDSVGGYLLAIATLRARKLEPAKLFKSQSFVGSYQAAVEAVLEGRADLTSVFAPPARPGAPSATGLEEILPGCAKRLSVLGFTDEAPNDGVAVAISSSPLLVTGLERALLALHQSSDGPRLLSDVFGAERFEPAPRMGYRALYRVALASL